MHRIVWTWLMSIEKNCKTNDERAYKEESLNFMYKPYKYFEIAKKNKKQLNWNRGINKYRDMSYFIQISPLNRIHEFVSRKVQRNWLHFLQTEMESVKSFVQWPILVAVLDLWILISCLRVIKGHQDLWILIRQET